MRPVSPDVLTGSRPHSWKKHMLVSAVPVVLTLVLHSVHLFAAPMLVGIMQAQAHHHAANGIMAEQSAVGINWFTAASLLLNVIGIVYAGRLMWLTRHVRKPDMQVYVCRGFSIAVIAISIWLFAASL